jgi:hypothetical protein
MLPKFKSLEATRVPGATTLAKLSAVALCALAGADMQTAVASAAQAAMRGLSRLRARGRAKCMCPGPIAPLLSRKLDRIVSEHD